MATPQNSDLDFLSVTRGINVPNPVLGPDMANKTYVDTQVSAISAGIAWKDSVRLSPIANVTLATPGATFDSVAAVAGDRILLQSQTLPAENGIYVWTGSAAPLTRATDANTANSLEAAVVTVEEGTTFAGITYRQTSVNFVLGTGPVTWTNFGTTIPVATSGALGVVQLATQAIVDAGVNTTQVVTAATFAAGLNTYLTTNGFTRKATGLVGNGVLTTIPFTHGLGTSVAVMVFEAGGSLRRVDVEVQITSGTVVTLVVAAGLAPATNAWRVVVIG